MKIAVFFLLFLTVFSAHGVSLQSPLPQGWKEISRHSQGQIYRLEKSRRDEMIVVQSFPAQSEDARLFENITPVQLTKVRQPIFAAIGLYGYRVLDIRRLSALQKNLSSQQILIEASYRDLTGEAVQSIERQYLVGQTMYVLSYRVNAKFIEDYDKVRALLDQFKPEIALAKGQSAVRTVAGELSQNRPGMSSPADSDDYVGLERPQEYEEPKMTRAQFDERCQNVPAEKRKSYDDPGFQSALEASFAGAKSCLVGVAEYAWDIVKSLGQMVYNGGRMVFDKEYRSEVAATAGTIAAEAYRHPTEFTKRVANSVYQAVNQYADDFLVCLNGPAKIEAVCKLASNLIPLGVVAKLVGKVPLAADEIENLVKIAREARKPYIEKAVDLKGDKAYKVAAGGDDTLSKAARSLEKRDIGVYVKEFPESKSNTTAYSTADKDNKPIVVFRKSVLKDPESQAGAIGHEATHAVNRLRANKAQELGRARTVRFKAQGDARLNPQMSTYKTYSRADEVHARAVQSGLELRQAEKAIAAGNYQAAKGFLKEASVRIDEGEKMRRAAKANFRLAREEIELSENFNHLHYNGKTGEVVVIVPLHTPEQVARLAKLKKIDYQAYLKAERNVDGVRVSVDVEAGLEKSKALKRAEEVLRLADQDIDRFNKSFQINARKLKELEARMP